MKTFLTAYDSAWVHGPLGQFMKANPDVFAMCETAHFIGLSILFGALMVMDLRALGYIRGVSYGATLKLTPVAILGLLINAVSGTLMYASHPIIYSTNWAFVWKLAFIVIATINAGWFVLAEHRNLSVLGPAATPSTSVKVTAALSLICWTMVLLLGRLLPTFATVAGG